jgi:hypothetical protein
MNKDDESYINHEVRIQVLEKIADDIHKTLSEIKNESRTHFIAVIFMIFTAIIIPVVLHAAKLT